MKSQRAVWRKSSHSNGDGGACLEVAALADDTHAVRDSKHRFGAVLCFPSDEWSAFVTAVRGGEFG